MVKHKKGLIAAAIIVVLVVADILGPLRVTQVSIRLAAEPVFRAGGLTVTNTLLSSWLATALLLLLALLVSRRLVDAPRATSLQNMVEAAFGSTLYNYMQSMVGPKARSFFPVVATFFLFILTSDWLGLLPGFGSVGVWAEYEGRRTLVPLLRGATTDLNTTLALAMCSVLSMQVYGARYLGILSMVLALWP